MDDDQNTGLDYSKIEVNELFQPIKKLFEFYILGIGFVGMPSFQSVFLGVHPSFRPLIESYNATVHLRESDGKVYSETGPYWILIGRIMAIAIFDVLQFSEYQKMLRNNSLFKFAKYIRNGAAHNNKFTFDNKQKMDLPISWSNKTLTAASEGASVFPDFISAPDLITLMHDISEVIKVESKK